MKEIKKFAICFLIDGTLNPFEFILLTTWGEEEK